ncbi:phospholipase D-like domain-containing protein [Flavimobilis rhizosphaerae]|nr:phospholipase D-like domain-containing protein [Flavimobilis rhizosphaerae]
MPLTENVRRALVRGAAVTVATPFALAGALVVAEAIKTYRHGRKPAQFPHLPPLDAEIGASRSTVFTYGEDLYAAMLEAIRGARTTVLLESYIWKSDELGEQFKQALIDAAARGVDVYVIYDAFANMVVPRAFYDLPAPIHVLRYPFVHAKTFTFNIRHLGRDHRKILVVDDEIGFVGGFNIGSLYATEWRDTHLRLVGPAVWDLRNAFVDFWNGKRKAHHPILPDPGSDVWDPHIRPARNVPSHMLFPIRGIYLQAIDRARRNIFITQAYFIPDEEMLDGLLAAARRGVDVRIIVPAASNHVLTDWLSRGFYTTLLAGGVTIWMFENAMVHAKTATIDGEWTTIGTANIDRLSLTGNYEINLEVYDRDVAAQMERVFATDLTNCRQLTLDEWSVRPWYSRLGERILAPLRPLL